MPTLSEKIEAEIENINRVLQEIPDYKSLPTLSLLELAGVATFLHNFYNGVENILKQILLSKNITVPRSDSWHRDLINISVENEVISEDTKQLLGEYLAFRHFFSHAYALDLYADKMEPLVKNINAVFKNFLNDISKYRFT
jgi:uncharacterized protein YutE (UPF0331/DUF86 family)